ncbi:hypothetical protein [Blattabacterium sp. (Nauphoeta cinerea)]|uniref:hypothetical protein n=1 Tax=Blattabacterium sp. (Nauphoeta cinerea) TaxID=1316444 RepID=UPI00041D60D0|nr:hypothetical protein [Blattabacterium sp. (Nauphoeta cinerea)]
MNRNNNYIDTYVQYNLMLKKCKFFLNEKLILIFHKKNKNNINDIILLKVYDNKWIDVINLSIIAIFFL